MSSDAIFGDGFGQIQARTRYEAMRSTPWIVSGLARGDLLGVYSGVDVRKAPSRLEDLSYLVLPATDLQRMAGRIIDSLIVREGAPGREAKAMYVEVGGRRVRAAAPATGMIHRLAPDEVDQICTGAALSWQVVGTTWRVLALPAREFNHPPLVAITGRPASQSIWALAATSAWEASAVAMLVRTKGAGS